MATTKTVKFDMAKIAAATDEELESLPVIPGMTAKQFRAICRVAENADMVLSTADDVIAWAQSLIDEDVATGKREHSFSVKNAGAACSTILGRLSAQRADRKAQMRSRQETENLTDRQSARLMQLVTWVRSLEFEDNSFEKAAQTKVLDQVREVMLDMNVTKASASDAMNLITRFAALVGATVPTSVHAPSDEGDPVPTTDDNAGDEDSVF